MLAPMAAIGIGAGLPWGLMDGLSVSVVPKERAGMATGIFSTTRVAGEGLALAMVSAALSALVGARLRAALPSLPGIDRDRLAAAAQQLATGDLAGAAARLPGVHAALLREQYVDAFSQLADGLAIMTVLAALATLYYLRPDRQTATLIANATVRKPQTDGRLAKEHALNCVLWLDWFPDRASCRCRSSWTFRTPPFPAARVVRLLAPARRAHGERRLPVAYRLRRGSASMIAWVDSLRLLFCAGLQNTAVAQAQYPSAISRHMQGQSA
jgi:hypothetical protein